MTQEGRLRSYLTDLILHISLVKQVKTRRQSDTAAGIYWWEFCDTIPGGSYDPAKIDPASLQRFLEVVSEDDEYIEDPDGASDPDPACEEVALLPGDGANYCEGGLARFELFVVDAVTEYVQRLAAKQHEDATVRVLAEPSELTHSSGGWEALQSATFRLDTTAMISLDETHVQSSREQLAENSRGFAGNSRTHQKETRLSEHSEAAKPEGTYRLPSCGKGDGKSPEGDRTSAGAGIPGLRVEELPAFAGTSARPAQLPRQPELSHSGQSWADEQPSGDEIEPPDPSEHELPRPPEPTLPGASSGDAANGPHEGLAGVATTKTPGLATCDSILGRCRRLLRPAELPRPPELLLAVPGAEQESQTFADKTQTGGHIAYLAKKIKHLQRTDPGAAALWAQHCVANFNGVKDPCRHDMMSLNLFLANRHGKGGRGRMPCPSPPAKS